MRGLRALWRPHVSAAVYRGSLKRNFARESEKPFQAPPDPPSTTIDKIRWPLVAVTFGAVAYIVFLPENDHGLFTERGTPPSSG